MASGIRQIEARPREMILRLRRQCGGSLAAHDLLLEIGALSQGLIDFESRELGYDESTHLSSLCHRTLWTAAHLLLKGQAYGPYPLVDALLSEISRLPLPGRIAIHAQDRTDESPESGKFARFAESRRAWSFWRGVPLRVIGIRGNTCRSGALISAAADAAPAVTIRPQGAPFEARVQIGPRLERELLRDLDKTHFVIAGDEPGLSGKSKWGIADWLWDRGVRAERIHFSPDHFGPSLKPTLFPLSRPFCDRLRRRPDLAGCRHARLLAPLRLR